MLANVDLVSVMLDRDARITHCNDSLLRLTGRQRDEVIGANWFDLFIPSENDDAKALFQELLAELPSTVRHENEILTRSGTRRIIRWYNTLLHSTAGEVIGTASMGDDITDRRNAEARMARLESRYRGLLEAAPDAMVVVNERGEIVLLNLQAEKQFGYRRDELLGQRVEVIIAEGFAERLIADSRRSAEDALAQQIGMGTDLTGRRKDGTDFPMEIMLSPLESSDGILVTAAIRDITTRKEAEASQLHTIEELRQSEERFRQMTDNIHEVFWMVDPVTREMLYVSPAYEQIWGRTCESLYAEPGGWLDAVHPDDRDRVSHAFESQSAVGRFDERFRISRPDGSIRWIHNVGIPVRDTVGSISSVVGVAQDVTAQRQLEEQLRQSQKMEAIGTLAGGIAHDFNNLLAVIGGYTELLKAMLAHDQEVSGALDAVALATSRAASLVRQILTFSRNEQTQRRPIRLAPVVEEAVRFLQSTLPSSIVICFESAAPEGIVLADATQIHQIVMNLGTNAWHAMRGRPGRLDLTLRPFAIDSDLAQMTQLQPGPYMRLSIADTGLGMDQATIDRIFEPFFTTKPIGEGTGLGLAVVHGIMRSHEGAVSVYSELGQGSMFHLYFPILASPVAHSEIQQGDPLRGHGERILYVDDEVQLASLGKRLLERLGYVVEPFTDAAEALALVRAEPQRFDLVITDHTMPGMTGIELARSIRRTRYDLPVILTTGYAGQITLDHLQTAGICDLLVKPPTIHALGLLVHRVMAGRTANSP
jgi:PAS domain S-box-containing protein